MGCEEPTLDRAGEEGARVRPLTRSDSYTVVVEPGEPRSLVELDAPLSKSFFYRYGGLLLTGRGCIIGVPEGRDADAVLDVLLAAGAALVGSDRVCLDYFREAMEYVVDVGCSGGALRVTLPALIAAAPMGSRIEARVCPRMFERLEDASIALFSHFGRVELRPESRRIVVRKERDPQEYRLVALASSQPASGALIAAAVTSSLLSRPVRVGVTVSVSKGHVYQTLEAMKNAGVQVEDLKIVEAGGALSITGYIYAEQRRLVLRTPGDWGLAALLLPLASLAAIRVRGLWTPWPGPGDHNVALYANVLGYASRAVIGDDGATWVVEAGRGVPGVSLSLGDEPDLAVAASFAAAALGSSAAIRDLQHLALKESDRLETVTSALRKLGYTAYHAVDAIIVNGASRHPLSAAELECPGDHRIAMGAAALACATGTRLTVYEAGCVEKSWAGFWHFIHELGLCRVTVRLDEQ